MRSVLSCQGFLIFVGETDDENASLCRHASADDLWIHLSERASPHAVVSIGDLKLLPGQEDHYRRTPDGRKMLDLGPTIYESALLVKFLSDSREDEETNAVYTRADSLLLNETNRGSGGSIYDILSGSTSHHDDDFAEMPGRVLLTRMPHFYRIEHDEHKVWQLLARSERSGSAGNMDREYAVWKEIMVQREATSRRDWYMRRSYGEQLFQDDSDDESELENGDIANFDTMEQNGDREDNHDTHDEAQEDGHEDAREDMDDMSVEQRESNNSDTEEAHNCDDNEKTKAHEMKPENHGCEQQKPTEDVQVQRVKETKAVKHDQPEDSKTNISKKEPRAGTEKEDTTIEPVSNRLEHDKDKHGEQNPAFKVNDAAYPESNKKPNSDVIKDGLTHENTTDQNKIPVKKPPCLNVVPEKRPNQDQNEKRRNVVRAVQKNTRDDQTENAKSTSEVLESRILEGMENKVL